MIIAPGRQIKVEPKLASFDPLKSHFKVHLVIEKFRRASNKTEFAEAVDYWMHLRDEIRKLEASQSGCRGGDGEFEIFMDAVDDLAGKPVYLTLSVIKMVMDVTHPDDRVLLKDLERAEEQIREFGLETAQGKVSEKAAEAYKKEAWPRIREGLVKAGKAASRRSGSNLRRLIDSFVGTAATAVTALSPAATAVKLAFTPSEIAGEWCGSVALIEDARAEALTRIYGAGPLGSSGVALPNR